MNQWPRSVAVVGAGVMGIQIAALLSAAGKRVVLLDLDEGGTSPGSRAKHAIALAESKNSPFYLPSHARSIECRSIADLSTLDTVDWIIEAVVEDIEIKKQVLSQIDIDGTTPPVVTSNTSGLAISELSCDRSNAFKKRFFGVHFFNPPRQMRLVEIISTPDTDMQDFSKVSNFLNSHLGKVVVRARDTPNFIANRLGVFSIFSLLHIMEKNNIGVGEIDALSGPLIGRPSSATLRLCDLIGIDTLWFVAQTSLNSETSQIGRTVLQIPKCIQQMLDKGLLGVKSGAGFYRKDGRSILALNWESMEYEPFKTAKIEGQTFSPKNTVNSICNLWDDNGVWGPILRQHLSELLVYTSFHAESISESFFDIDQAMKYGFNWELGPFEIWDALGKDRIEEAIQLTNSPKIDWFEKFKNNAKDDCIYRNNKILEIFNPSVNSWEKILGTTAINRSFDTSKIVQSNDGAYLWDAGDGIGVLVLRGKLNALGADTLELVGEAISDKNFSSIVLCGHGENFSVGANLCDILDLCEVGTHALEKFLLDFQTTTQMIKNSSIPITASIHGLCLGGGCEFSLSSHFRVVSSEARLGLVESGVGLVPSGGGILHRVERISQGCDILKEFRVLFMGVPCTNAFTARDNGYLFEQDIIRFGTEPPLETAIEKARLLVGSETDRNSSNYIKVSGRNGLDIIYSWLNSQLENEVITEHDQAIGKAIAVALCGGDGDEREVTRDEILAAEREAFHRLVSTQKTRERIDHTLRTGKLLKN